jgi:Pyruvate/2-oxoacid:ferredoxin oxidoreductase delta subunit
MWPGKAVTKLGFGPDGEPRYAIDLEFCEGRGLCVAQCPAGAVVMIPETGEE